MTVVEDEVAAPAPQRRRPRTVRSWAAFAFLTAFLLVMTKGPLYWVRQEWARWTSDPIDDVWVQSAFVTSSALVLALCLPAARVLGRDRLVVGAFAALVGAVILSTLWSVDAARTFEQGLMMFVGTAAALLAGAFLRRLDAVVAVWLAMQVGVALSLWAWWRDWPGAFKTFSARIGRDPELTGIYFSRNSLGPVAAIAAATSIVLFAAIGGRRWSVAARVALVLMFVVDMYVWVRTGSLTPAAALGTAVVVTVLLALMLPGRGVRWRRSVGVASMAAAAAAGLAVAGAWALGSDVFGRRPTFSGRTIIWQVVLEFVDERPVAGWGFMAIWRLPGTPDRFWGERPEDKLITPPAEAHSGYVEILLGVGIIGLTLLLLLAAVAAWRTGRAFWRTPNVVTAAWFGAVVYALAINLGETYVGANLVPWLLLCVATGGASADHVRRRSRDAGGEPPPDDPTDPPIRPTDRSDPADPTDPTDFADLPAAQGDEVDWDAIDEIIGVSYETDGGRTT